MIQKALLVDDDEMILDILECILKSNGYDITRATDVDVAIKTLDAENFDLVVTDLQIGHKSGFDVIRKTKDVNFSTIAIMITGSCDSSDEVEAFQHGADDYLLKPFSPSDLLVRIHFQKLKQFFIPALTLEDEHRTGNMSG